MAARLLLVLGLGLCLALAIVLVRAWVTLRTRRVIASARWQSGHTPSILAFSTSACAECRLRQKPALQEATARLGAGAAVVHIDALERTDLAERFGVLTVPSSVVVDRQGRPVAVNHGFAAAELLIDQVRRAASA